MSITIYRKHDYKCLHTIDASTLNKADLSGLGLTEADLSSRRMRGCNLSSVYLKDAYLTGSDLHSADLSYADLRGADFSFSNLSGANFLKTDLSTTSLHGALLTGAKYRGNRLDKLMSISGVAEHGPIMFYTTRTHGLFVQCGCRHMAYEGAVVYWANRPDRVMTRVALAMGKAWYDALPKPVVKKRVVNKKAAVKSKATAKAKAKAKRGKR